MPRWERAVDDVARIAAAPTDLVTLWRSVSDVLARAVPHHLAPCWYPLDPASLLMTSHFNEGMPEFPGEWLEEEIYGDDVNHVADVARSDAGITTLHDATGGDPASSPRWHDNMQMGCDRGADRGAAHEVR